MRDDVAVRTFASLLWRHMTLRYLLRHQRMVSGDLLEPSGANEICAGISDAGDCRVFAPDDRDNERRTHHLRLRLALPTCKYQLIGTSKGLLDEWYDVSGRISGERVLNCVNSD